MKALNENGTPDLQAGSHPFELVTSFVLNEPEPFPGGHGSGREVRNSGGDLKDVRVQLPPGFVGDPNATPKCTDQEFITHGGGNGGGNECPNDNGGGVCAHDSLEHRSR